MKRGISKKLLRDVCALIETKVAIGFAAPADIVAYCVHCFSEEASADSLRPIAEKLVASAVKEHLAKQAEWPEVTDCDRLTLAFAELEQKGILCRQDYSDCMTCGHFDLKAEAELAQQQGREVRGYVFFHGQDTESLLDGDLFLAFGRWPPTPDEIDRIVQVLLSAILESGDASRSGIWAKAPDPLVQIKNKFVQRDPPATADELEQELRTFLTDGPILERSKVLDIPFLNKAALSAIAEEVVATLVRHGLNATWSGSGWFRIGVEMDWKKRR
jgi:hypothetical protein